ncbi:hypothetical protein MTQ10_29950 [Streptomyces sp. XM83C]|jgi:hypothetical protein|uniref:hypothetical protein n=1 Tax=unclassified Streptomyces TaxID=2593676 RepID=UPI001FF8833A|nr:hypothetical protein [Streptomyces sp. XM83C]MCK1823692.1 hypothetical protein [Streptomyces sp. XM83C]
MTQVSHLYSGDRKDVAKFIEIVNLLKSQRSIITDNANEFKRSLPAWLSEQFSPPMSPADKEAWLSRWRKASPGEKVALERERGWEAGQWLYWFSRSNDFWEISEVCAVADHLVEVRLSCADTPAPIEAMRWLAAAAGLRSSGEA